MYAEGKYSERKNEDTAKLATNAVSRLKKARENWSGMRVE